MRLSRFIIATALSAISVCLSCSSQQNDSVVGAGKILPDITVSPSVTLSNGTDVDDAVAYVPEVQALSMRITGNDGAYSATWPQLADYYPAESVLPGVYLVEAFYGSERLEGFDVSYYYGSVTCTVKDGSVEQPQIDCRLANTVVSVDFNPLIADEFESLALTLHSFGGDFIKYSLGESRQAYLRPGNIDVGLSAVMPDGSELQVHMLTIREAQAGHWYKAQVSLSHSPQGYPVITVSFDAGTSSDDVSVTLSPDFIAAPAPLITCSGFESGVPVTVAEGQTPDTPLTMSVSAESLSHLMLSATAPSLISKGWLPEVDLMSDTDISAMIALGLKITRTDVITLDFTALIPYLRDTDGLADVFALQAESRIGKMSAPAQLLVNLKNADVNIVSMSMPVIGVDIFTAKVECSEGADPANISLDIFNSGAWTELKPLSLQPAEEPNNYELSFAVPSGTNEIPARLMYCGISRNSFKIYRISPEFKIEVDAFALKAVIRIVPEDETLLGVITRLVRIYADGSRTIQLDRNEEQGTLTVTGLRQNTTYTFRASVMDTPKEGEFTPAVTVTTESAASLPNGDLENIVSKRTKYSDMPSGGRYSQNIVEIFNLQNYTSFDFTTPEKWATVNAKTFNTGASNINTWYVIPTVRTVDFKESYAGTSYAVRIDNVAWDNNGPAIPDYLQEGQPYVKYSRNVPKIRYKAVGKLFIGSYKFDPATLGESYSEGMAFGSRPSALNGFYRFIPIAPQPDELGYACIEVLAEDGSVIAKGETVLAPATGYTAFSVPLTYSRFGVKASRIKVMLAASPRIGDIQYESQNTLVVPDPQTSTMTGSSLWIDEVSLSY